MRPHAPKASASSDSATQMELALLGIISLIGVAIVTFGAVNRPEVSPITISVDYWNVAAIFAALILSTSATLWQIVRTMKREATRIRTENAALQRRLLAAESIIKAEPQVLIYWEPGQPLSVVAHSLTSVPGLPENHRDLLRFGQWLQPAAASELKAGLDGLFGCGRAFNIVIKTRGDGYVEAEGHTAGGRAVLRLRDVVGHRRDLSRILTQHQALTRDVRASRAILDSLPSPIWLKNEHGAITWTNAAYNRAVESDGQSAASVSQLELLETRQRQAVDRAVSQGQPYRERLQLVIGGERKPHDIVVIPVEGGQASAALDITAAVQAQGELDRQSAAYERTLDQVATAVAIFGADRRLAYFNDAYQRLWQLDAVWLKSSPTENALLDSLRENARLPETGNYREWKAKFLGRVRATPSTQEDWHLPDGRALQVLAECRADGSITYLFVDQTERLALESRYNQQLKSQGETLDSLKEGVAVFGTDGRLKFNNAAFAAIWQLDSAVTQKQPHLDDLIGAFCALKGAQTEWAAISKAVTHYSDERSALDGTMTRTDDTVLAYAALPLPDGATLLTFTDITDAKRYERALVERNDALITADRLKNQFIGHVSYELRTPLTNIIGFSDFLSSPLVGTMNPKQCEYLNDITASSKTLLAIIDDILDLATIDAGALELKLAPVSVSGIIDAAIEGVRDRAIQAKLTIDIGQAEDALTFTADESRVRQVLYNLVSNAVGFSKIGDTIQITAWRHNGMMLFAVQDQGIGVPKDQQASIFGRFESRSRGSAHRGVGLGLSLVKSLVDLHGGTVEFTSDAGVGTRVVVAFPERATALITPAAPGSPAVNPASPLSVTAAALTTLAPVFIPGLPKAN